MPLSSSLAAQTAADGLLRGQDGRLRCFWAGHDPLYQRYHDSEWGLPGGNSRRIFENLCLEGFQAGLSWLTVLRKREALHAAFADFDYAALAAFSAAQQAEQTARLMQNSGIIRHRGKIAAVFSNARAAQRLEAEYGSLAAYLRRFLLPAAARFRPLRHSGCRSAAPEAKALAKDLKRRGFAFIGPTGAYAFMQAMGMVNDHNDGCCRRHAAEAAQKAFYPA